MKQTATDILMVFDIETVSEVKHFTELSERKLQLFKTYLPKLEKIAKDKVNTEGLTGDNYLQSIYSSTAGIVPEFGKICAVSIGIFKDNKEHIMSFWGEDEKDILIKTNKLFNNAKGKYFLCGHNIKQFDIPYIVKRSYINGITPSVIFPTADTKPWEVEVVDTKEMWNPLNRMGWGSLDLISCVLGLDSSKQGEVTGGSCTEFYYKGGVEQIKDYCERDVSVTMAIVKRIEEIQLGNQNTETVVVE